MSFMRFLLMRIGLPDLSLCWDDRRLLLYKYRRHLRKLRLTDNELADTFKRLTRAGSTDLAPELFHSAVSRELDVVLTSGVRFLMVYCFPRRWSCFPVICSWRLVFLFLYRAGTRLHDARDGL